MTLLEQFVAKVRTEDGSFQIPSTPSGDTSTKTCYSFMQNNINGNRFVYGNRYEAKPQDLLAEAEYQPALIAIVTTDNHVYIMDDYIFRKKLPQMARPPVPENAEFFNPERFNKEVQDTVYKNYYDSLPVRKLDADIIQRCKNKARQKILWLNFIKERAPEYLSEKEILSCICGFSTFEEILLPKLEREREYLITEKSIQKQVQEHLDNPDLVTEEWERTMAAAINAVKDNANSINVTFEYNGNVASNKMAPRDLLRALLNGEYLDAYLFLNQTSARAMIRELGAANNGHSDCAPLYCHNITKITYGRQELYSKQSPELEQDFLRVNNEKTEPEENER